MRRQRVVVIVRGLHRASNVDMSKRSSSSAGLPPAAAASGRPMKLANSGSFAPCWHLRSDIELKATVKPPALPHRPPADLNMMYLSKFESAGVGKQRREKEDTAWGNIPTAEQKEITDLVTRYCMLKYSSGAGFIEEVEIKKVISEKHPTLIVQTIVKPALRSAQLKLRSLIGAELMPVFQTLTAGECAAGGGREGRWWGARLPSG